MCYYTDMNENKMKTLIQVGTVIAVILIVVLLAVLLLQTVQINVLEERRERLQLKIDELEQSRQTLEEELEHRQTEAFIEKYARENLGMIKKGEILFTPN